MHGCVDMYTWATEARRGLRSLESEAAGWYEQPHLGSGTQLRSPARARSPCTTNPSLHPEGYSVVIEEARSHLSQVCLELILEDG